jgi:hypothetical protein
MPKAQPKKRPPRRAAEVKDLSVKEKERSGPQMHARCAWHVLETGDGRRCSETVWKDTKMNSAMIVKKILSFKQT